jgi:glutathione S-transferase
VADAYLFTILRWTGVMKIDMSGFANVVAYMGHIANRENVRQALLNEGLLKAA